MVGKIRKLTTFGLALCMTIQLCFSASAEPQFRLDMDNLNLQKGVSCNIVITLENAKGADIVDIEGLENFEILSQSQGSSTSIIGGTTTYEEYLYYTVMPKILGQFTLKANIQYDGQSYESNMLEVTVNETSSENDVAAQDIFVNTVISHTEAYLGEKVVITYELYSRYDIEGFGFTDYTAIDGMIAKDMPEEQLIAEYVYIDGVRYAKYEVKQLILDPIKSGTHIVPSFNLQVNVVTDSGLGGIFGGGLFNRSQSMYLQTEEKQLLVKPLPVEGKPKDFSGIVGELSLSGNYSQEEINYGDSISLRITASGNCNLDGFKNIFTKDVPGFNVYETHKNTTESVESNQYYTQKEFEAILVPEQTGVLDIASVSVSYFNPVTEKYEEAEITGTSIEVLGDIPRIVENQNSVIETVMINQVNYGNLNSTDDYFTIPVNKQDVYKIIIVLFALIVLVFFLIWLIFKRKKQDNVMKVTYKKLMKAQDINEVYNLFNLMINHCYKISLKACSKDFVRNGLPNVDLADRVTGVMDYMEFSKEKKCVDLKNKINDVYRMILRFQKSSKSH